MTDFTVFERSELPTTGRIEGSPRWDVLLSAFNKSERVQSVFSRIEAQEKWWLVHPEYRYTEVELPLEHVIAGPAGREDDFILYCIERSGLTGRERLCIDITGFMRPHLLFLLRYLKSVNQTVVDMIYSEPVRYRKNELTEFSRGDTSPVRQVCGFEGVHGSDTTRDVLVIGTGYDYELMARVAYAKKHARKLKMYGLPSLRVHMYQENALQVSRAAEAMGGREESVELFAPANDPFATAQVLQDAVAREAAGRGFTNLYLSPLGTKVQALGFGLYYLSKCAGWPVSIIYPFHSGYDQETSRGVSRIWQYRVELGWLLNRPPPAESKRAPVSPCG
jgi:hypothetical protein